jgi:hypothetical protein
MKTEVDADGVTAPDADIARMQVVAHRGTIRLDPVRAELETRITLEGEVAVVVDFPQIVVLSAGQVDALELLEQNRTLRFGLEVVDGEASREPAASVFDNTLVGAKLRLRANQPLTTLTTANIALLITLPDERVVAIRLELRPVVLNGLVRNAGPTSPFDVLRHSAGVAEQVHHEVGTSVRDAGLVSPPRPAADLPLHHATDRRSSLDLRSETLTLKRGKRFDAGREQLDAVLLGIVDFRTVAEEVGLHAVAIRHRRTTLRIGEVVDFDLAHNGVLVGADGRERRVSILCHSAPIVPEGKTVSSLVSGENTRT